MFRILIADDNPLSLRFFLEATAALDVESHGVSDGEAALHHAQQSVYDLLILDWHMPKLDGIGVLKKLRSPATILNANIPAIATSAELTREQSAELLSAGFSATLLKPLSIVEFESTLRQFLPQIKSIASKAAPSTVAEEESYNNFSLLDDGQALSASGGDPAVMRALRQLFAKELEALPTELAALAVSSNPADLRDRLHRLSASAGFCGAQQLESTINTLRHIQLDGVIISRNLAKLLNCCEKTQHALRAKDVIDNVNV